MDSKVVNLVVVANTGNDIASNFTLILNLVAMISRNSIASDFVQSMDTLMVTLPSAASLGQLKVKNLSMTADSAKNLL